MPDQFIPRVVPPRLHGPFASLLPNANGPGVPEAIKRIAAMSIGLFTQAFLISPTPRERIQPVSFRAPVMSRPGAPAQLPSGYAQTMPAKPSGP